MPQSYANEQFRIAREDDYGVAPGTPAWKILTAVRFDPQPNFETEEFMGAGDTAPSVSVVNDEWTVGDVSGKACYNSAGYVLSSLFGPPTTQTPGGGTTSRQHDWVWDGRSPLIPVSYLGSHGVAGAADSIPGMVFNTLGISGGRGGFDFSSSVLAKATTAGAALGGATNEVQTATITGTPTGGTFTLTAYGQTTAAIAYNATAAAVQAALEALGAFAPGDLVVGGGPGPGTPYTIAFAGAAYGGRDVPAISAAGSFTGGTSPAIAVTTTTPGADAGALVPPVPVFPLHGDVYMDSTMAGVGTTKLLALYSVGLDFGDRLARTTPINSQRTSDGLVETSDQEHTCSLQFGVDPVERANFGAIRAGALRFVRVKFEGNVIEAAIKYLMQFDLCLAFRGVSAKEDTDSVLTRTWDTRIMRDPVSAVAAKVRLINTMPSY